MRQPFFKKEAQQPIINKLNNLQKQIDQCEIEKKSLRHEIDKYDKEMIEYNKEIKELG